MEPWPRSVFLWYPGTAGAAYDRYRSVFDLPGDPSGENFIMGTLEVAGTTPQLFNGGPHHDFNDAISLFVAVETQEEIERLSDGLIAGGGSQGNCGWLKDPFGVSWQIVPVQLGALLGGGDPEVSGRVHQAIMGMHRLNIAELEAAASA